MADEFDVRVAALDERVVLPLFTVDDLRDEPEVTAEPEPERVAVLDDLLTEFLELDDLEELTDEREVPVDALREPMDLLLDDLVPTVSDRALEEALETAVETPDVLREPLVWNEPAVRGVELTAPVPELAMDVPPLRP